MTNAVDNGIRRCASGVLAAVLLVASTGAAADRGDATVIPFVKGTAWTYAGTVRWTDPPNTIRNNDVRWVSDVVDAFDHGDVAAALISGRVWDLPSFSREKRRGGYALVRVATRYYFVWGDAKKTFAVLKKSGAIALTKTRTQEPWFDTPLKKGQVVARAPDMGPRDDTGYGWWVESAAPVRLDLPGMTSVTRRGYLLSFRTLASEEHMTIVPGIGITSFAYVHRGTIAETHLRLVDFRRGTVHRATFPGKPCLWGHRFIRRKARMRVTAFVDVLSHWCLAAQPALEALRAKLADDVALEVVFAPVAAVGFTHVAEAWFYERGTLAYGTRLNAAWCEDESTSTWHANAAMTAAVAGGANPVELAPRVSRAAMVDGALLGREDEVVRIVSRLAGVAESTLRVAMRGDAVVGALHAANARLAAIGCAERPSWELVNDNGDKAVLQGVWQAEAILPLARALLDDERAYRRAGPPPA